MSKKMFSDPVIKFFVVVIGIVVIGITLKELSHIFLPFVIAYLLFFTFSPVNNYLTGKKVPLFLVILFDISIMIFILWGVFSFLIESFIQFGAELPEYFNRLNTIVRDAAKSLGVRDTYFKNFSIQKVLSSIDYKIIAEDIFSSTFPVMGSVLFVLFFYIFIVTGHSGIYESFKRRYVTKKVEPEIRAIKKRIDEDKEHPVSAEIIEEEIHDRENILSNTFKTINEQIQHYIIAKVMVNLAAGITVSVILYFMGIDFPVIWGLFVFLFNFIPSIGSAFALVLPSLMALLQFQSVSFALVTALVLGAAQTIFFNIIEPMIIGRRLNLNPLLILISVLIWGYIWGIIGMLLSVPLTAIIKITISNSKSKNLIFINNLMSKEVEGGEIIPSEELIEEKAGKL
jgi:AI-2 transport protein TqsA